MKKKLLSTALCAVMASTLVAGCGNSGNIADNAGNADDASKNTQNNAESTTGNYEGETETVVMYTPFVGNNEDADKVIEAINEITVPEIGVQLDWQQFDIGQWFQQYSLFLSGTDDIDILFNFGGITAGTSQGAFMELDDLLDQYGQGIQDELGEYIVSGEVNGTMYGLVPKTLYAATVGMTYRQDIVKELGLESQVEAVKTLADWGDILEQVKVAYPNMQGFVTGTGTSMANFFYGDWDYLGDSMGVLMDNGQTSEVVDLFETDEYKEMCEVMSDWYQKGYTSKDIQTQTDSFSTLASQDAAFSTYGAVDETTAYNLSGETGKEIGVVYLAEPFAKTYTNASYAIMANSQHPEAAMRFLNMMYTDSRILNLMSWGIEGVHYKVLEDGTLDYADGTDVSSCTYHDQLGACANSTLRALWCTQNPDLYELTEDGNKNAEKSVAMGFVFDSSNVINEVTQVDNVLSKYRNGIESGAMDADETLPKFIEELKNAGIDKVIEEKQNQLDNWLANR